MKKYFLLALLGLFSFGALASCDDRNNDVITQDNDTYSVVLDLNNVNFVKGTNNQYSISRNFTSPLFSTDVVLIYRKAGSASDGSPVWQQIPRTVYLSSGRELDYDFGWTKLPFDNMEMNTIYMYATIVGYLLFNAFKYEYSAKLDFVKPQMRLKNFILHFVILTAKWIKKSRRQVLQIFTSKDYSPLWTSP